MAEAGALVAAPHFGRVVVVASLGGLEILIEVLAGLPATYPIPVAVVLHRSRTSDGHDSLTGILSYKTQPPVRLAEAGTPANLPGITVVPAKSTATIDEAGFWSIAEGDQAVASGDALLQSSAAATRTVAVILTGAMDDGAVGCRAVRSCRGYVLVQDPTTARGSSMPASAIATGCVDEILPPDELASALIALSVTQGAA